MHTGRGLQSIFTHKLDRSLAQGAFGTLLAGDAPFLPFYFLTGITVPAGTGTAVTLFCGEPSISRSE